MRILCHLLVVTSLTIVFVGMFFSDLNRFELMIVGGLAGMLAYTAGAATDILYGKEGKD